MRKNHILALLTFATVPLVSSVAILVLAQLLYSRKSPLAIGYWNVESILSYPLELVFAFAIFQGLFSALYLIAGDTQSRILLAVFILNMMTAVGHIALMGFGMLPGEDAGILSLLDLLPIFPLWMIGLCFAIYSRLGSSKTESITT